MYRRAVPPPFPPVNRNLPVPQPKTAGPVPRGATKAGSPAMSGQSSTAVQPELGRFTTNVTLIPTAPPMPSSVLPPLHGTTILKLPGGSPAVWASVCGASFCARAASGTTNKDNASNHAGALSVRFTDISILLLWRDGGGQMLTAVPRHRLPGNSMIWRFLAAPLQQFVEGWLDFPLR